MSIEQLADNGIIRNEQHELVRKKRDGFVVDDRILILVQKKENR